MPNIENIDRKISALQSKNVSDIKVKNIPFGKLGTSYTSTDLQDIFNHQISLLTNAKTMTDTQIRNARTSIYNSLNKAGKTEADKIINGEDFSLEAYSTTDYNKLVDIVLYTFSLT